MNVAKRILTILEALVYRPNRYRRALITFMLLVIFLVLSALALLVLSAPVLLAYYFFPFPTHAFFGLFSFIFPVVSFVFSFINSRFLGPFGLVLISCFSLFFSSVFSFFCFLGLAGGQRAVSVVFGQWFSFSFFEVLWSFSFDPISVPMFFVVSTVSCLVHLYSFEYMSHDRNLSSFITFLFFFTRSMLLLLCSGNLVLFFMGWEFIGLRSFLLVGFWTTRSRASSAALKAVFVNRIGDFFLLILVVSILFSYGSSEFYLLPSLVESSQSKFLFLAFLAARAKSAQLGLHIWLPDAMEGPTPVSALIHAATLVTAGLFLLYRFTFLLPQAPDVASIVCAVGRLTAFFSATVASVQSDIKKVIAYSTCSQLGLMFYSWGFFHPELSFFHMATHAFFKACLFLSAGSIIHAFSGEQDMRRMGNCFFSLPLTFAAVTISSFSLVGFPYTSGFFSKDQILEASYVSSSSMFFHFLSLATTFLTAFYSTKLVYLVFFGPRKVNKYSSLSSSHLESGFFMSLPLFVLSFFSIAFGYFFFPFATGPGTFYWGSFLPLPFSHGPGPLDFHFLSFFLKLAPLFLTLSGIFCGILFFKFFSFSSFSLFFPFTRPVFQFFISKWGFDQLYNKLIIYFFMPSFKVYLDNIDRGVLERFFVGFPFSASLRLFLASTSFASLNSFFFHPMLVVSGFIFLLYGFVVSPWAFYFFRMVFFFIFFFVSYSVKPVFFDIDKKVKLD